MYEIDVLSLEPSSLIIIVFKLVPFPSTHIIVPPPTSPEGVDTLGLEDPGGAVNDTGVGFVKPALLDHLILVLDKQLHPLDGSSGGLGHTCSYAREHKALGKS